VRVAIVRILCVVECASDDVCVIDVCIVDVCVIDVLMCVSLMCVSFMSVSYVRSRNRHACL